MPGRDGNSNAFGEIEAESWAIHPRWNPKAPQPRYDYALITLDREVGNQNFKSLRDKPLGFWGSDQDGGGTLIDTLPVPLLRRLIGTRMVTAGYPQSKKQEMWCAAGEFSTGSAQMDAQLTRAGRVEQWVTSNSVFRITADATQGQSGSPVWVVDNGKRYLIGIIEAAGQTYNDVIALNAAVMSQIQVWMGSGGSPSRAREFLKEPEIKATEQSEEDARHSEGLGYARRAGAGGGQPGPMREWDVTPVPASPAVVDPFPRSALPLTLDRSNATMNRMMAAVASDPALSSLCAALVDLTGNPANPPYAGFNDQDMVYVGSLQKISAAYAAFELRARVRTQVAAAINGGLSTGSAGWERPVINALETAWQPKLTSAFPGLPTGFPSIGSIFSFSRTGDVDFAAAPLTDKQVEDVGEFGRIEVGERGNRPAGKFNDAMRSMLRWSNDSSAGFCIRPLSFPYINGVLAGAGFFDGARQPACGFRPTTPVTTGYRTLLPSRRQTAPANH